MSWSERVSLSSRSKKLRSDLAHCVYFDLNSQTNGKPDGLVIFCVGWNIVFVYKMIGWYMSNFLGLEVMLMSCAQNIDQRAQITPNCFKQGLDMYIQNTIDDMLSEWKDWDILESTLNEFQKLKTDDIEKLLHETYYFFSNLGMLEKNLLWDKGKPRLRKKDIKEVSKNIKSYLLYCDDHIFYISNNILMETLRYFCVYLYKEKDVTLSPTELYKILIYRILINELEN